MMRYSKIIVLLLLLFIPFTAHAHPGGTDANGGHYNRSTGEYHYHHGYPEHQHENGECPYDFDDKTGINSGGNASSEINENDSNSVTNSSSQNNTKVSFAEKHPIITIFINFIGILFIIILALSFIVVLIQLGWYIVEELMHTPFFRKCRAKYRNSKSKDAFHTNFPLKVYKDCYSKPIGPEPYQEKVFITRSGTKYHNKNCTMLKRNYLELTLTEAKRRGYTPCSKCNPPKQ